ncbi:MAG: PIN domain-containing protein, partial [Planctomycetaceae bacterium]
SSGGPNALDFHIACYIGRLSVTEPESDFVIMSGDTGFDSLITHLQSLQVRVRRWNGGPAKKAVSQKAAQRPADSPAKASTPPLQTGKTPAQTETGRGKPATKSPVAAAGVAQWELLEHVLERLGRMQSARPKTVKSFRSMFREVLAKQKSEDAADELLRVLEQRGAVKNENGKLTWDYRRSLCAELS